MSKNTFTATAPDGTTFTRKTANAYTHAVIGFRTPYGATEPRWELIGFCSRKELAEKTARAWVKTYDRIVIVLSHPIA